MDIKECLAAESHTPGCKRIWENEIYRVAVISIILIPLLFWVIFVNILNYKIPEFWLGAYTTFVIGYLAFLIQQKHEINRKWYRALCSIEAQCYDVWNRLENERAKIQQCIKQNQALYEFPPELTIPFETIDSLGRIGVKNACARIRWRAEGISNDFRMLAAITAEQPSPIQLAGLIGDMYRACDEKANELQKNIIEAVKSIKFFLKNDKPKIIMPPKFSKVDWGGWMDKDPEKVSKELTSKIK